ncbi:MAG: nickel-dependent lactate racemase [Anaerolineae bacterium]|nr:nickel-dependent lactate racemase [Anaerolineae bacterium]
MVKLAYANQIVKLDIPAKNIIFDLSPADAEPAPDPRAAVRAALAHPLGTPALDLMVRRGMKVVIIADDNTRITPTKMLVPILLDALNAANIPDKDIQVIVASGTHRPMTEAEIDAKYGEPVLSRVPVTCHNYKDLDNLVDYGTTKRGTRVIVNRQVVEADFRIGVGMVIPHHPAGWAAGAKIVLPGVGGEETVAHMHLLGSRGPALGKIDTEMRREMEEFAGVIGLNFVLQVVLNRHEQLVSAFAGHFITAHRAAVKRAEDVSGAPFAEMADLTLSSTAPVDYDFFQADKGIFAAELCTRHGGEIVLVSACYEGVSPAHPELADYTSMPSAQIWEMLARHKIPDPLTGAEAIVLNDLREKMSITLATEGLSPALAARLGCKHVKPGDLNRYLRERLAQEPGLKIGILRQSAEVLPVFRPAGKEEATREAALAGGRR